MSDFAGLWRLDGRSADRSDLERMARGLEGRGILAPKSWLSGSFGLIHRQHLFTPEDNAERMPLTGPSGYVVAADCRLNDRDALRRSLDVRQTEATDAALILAALERWDRQAPEKLFGDYVFAMWDPRQQRLILARDPNGYRTLYLYRSERLIAFSTRVRALLALPEIPRELDERSLANFLTLNHGPPARTLYRAIDRIPMGHIAVIGAASLHVSAHWSQPVPGTLHRRDDREYLEEAREVIDRAVADALRSQGPATLLLSGGLDSSTIAESGVRHLAPAPLLAVTRVPDGPTPDSDSRHYHDESPRARALAARLPTLDWHPIPGDGGDWGEHDVRRFFLEGGAPTRAPQNVAWFFPIYRFMASRGSRVTLGGEFGNAYFSDSGLGFLPGMLLSLRWWKVATEIHALARTQKRSHWAMVKRHILRPFEPVAWRLRRCRVGTNPWESHSALNPAFAAEAGLDRDLDPALYRMRIGGSHLSVPLMRQWMAVDETARDFRGTFRALTGIDHRLPMADRRVVEFFGALPPDQLLRGGVTRSIARRLLDGRAPEETVRGHVGGLQNGDWFQIVSAQRPAMLADLERLRSHRSVARIVDLDRLQGLLDDWPADPESAEKRRPEYLQMLTRGMEMARFLAWHEGGND